MDFCSWMDVVPLGMFFVVLWRALGNTVFEEGYKLLAVVAGIFVSIHFYPDLGKLLQKTLVFEPVSHSTAFTMLFVATYAAFCLGLDGWMILAKIDRRKTNPLGISILLAVLRGALLTGQVLLALLLLNNPHIQDSFRQSLTGGFFTALPAGFYRSIFLIFVKTIYSEEIMNDMVLMFGP